MDRIQLTVTLPNIAPEHLAEFKSLAAGVLEIAREEPNTLQHDWFFNDDETTCVVRETYADSKALLAHMASAADLSSKLVELAGGIEVEAFGDLSPELAEAAADLHPAVYRYFQGK